MQPSGSPVLAAVFFVQGLAFYTLSVSALVVAKPRAALAMARWVSLLAAFGFLHSAASWLELLQQLLPTGTPLVSVVAPLPTALLLLYSFSLAQFGANVIGELTPRYHWIRAVPLALLLWAVVPALIVGVHGERFVPGGLVAAEAMVRYIIYLPAALMSAAAFHFQGMASSFDRLPALRRDCRLAALAFAVYALSGGFLVPTSMLLSAEVGGGHAPSAVAQLPVQVVRLLLAPLIAWVVVRTLRVFELEHMLEVEDLSRQLQRLSRAAVTAQEEERKRIALELHDETAQLLSSLLVHLKLLQGVRGLDDLKCRCAEMMALAAEAAQSIRRTAGELRPVALDDLGLVAALQWHVERFAKREGLVVEMKAIGMAGRTDPEVELAVYRIVQECLRNVAKHAHANVVSILLQVVGGSLRVTVSDDGSGYDPLAMRRSDNAGLGVLGMSERAALVGGTMNVQSQPGRGTSVQVEVPFSTKSPAGVN